jgi:transposase
LQVVLAVCVTDYRIPTPVVDFAVCFECLCEQLIFGSCASAVWVWMGKRRYEEVEPEVQRAIVKEYRPGVRGRSMRALAEKHGLPEGTVATLLRRGKLTGGKPVRPRGHKQRRLDAKQERKLRSALKQNPWATNRQLKAAVGGEIAERTVSDYLARADPPYTRKVVVDQEPEERNDEWKEEVRAWVRRVRRIKMSRRVYADETAVYTNEAPKKGRSPKGEPIVRVRPRWAKRFTLHLFAKRTGVVHWELSAKNADTAEVERVAVAAAEKLNAGDVVVWDRLGRSGRSVNPKAQHYSPAARATFEGQGVGMEHLPPKGKYLNPVELLFNDLKSHYIRPAFPVSGEKLSLQQLESLIEDYVRDRAPATLPGFFDARANGAEATKSKLI